VSKVKRAVASMNLAFFPMLYFYYFMYYTESLSMLLLLLMHYHYSNGFDNMSAFYGSYSISFELLNPAGYILRLIGMTSRGPWSSDKTDEHCLGIPARSPDRLGYLRE